MQTGHRLDWNCRMRRRIATAELFVEIVETAADAEIVVAVGHSGDIHLNLYRCMDLF